MTIILDGLQKHQYRRRSRTGAFWLNSAILVALALSDLLCFIAADLFMRLFATPPTLVLFLGRVIGTPNTAIDLTGIIALVFVIVHYLVGDYSRRQLFWDGARATTGTLLAGGFIYVIAVLLLEPSGTWAALLAWTSLIFLLPSLRQITKFLLGCIGIWHRPTAILGTSETAQDVFAALARQLSLGLDVRWVVPENSEKPVSGPLSSLQSIHAAPENLASALLAVGCRQVILVPDDRLAVSRTEIIAQMIGVDIAVSIVPSLRRLPLFGMSPSYFFGKDLLLLQVRNNLARLPQRFIKRTMDIVGSFIALMLLSPLIVVIAYLIKKEDGGPVFFLQNRVGRNGRDFRCWKFRTMSVDAEEEMARWAKEDPALLENYRASNFKLKSDPRVTRIGALLRRKSLDELPQLLNTFLGQMSLVGPRPLLRRELHEYGVVITLYERVRPGITGLWQVGGRSHTTFSERASYDEWYILNWTVWYDLVIIMRTIWVLARSEGAY
jgi:Undecaprenyl-phosphate galactose phosphotransferase WbaP